MANRIKQLREREGIKQIDLASFLNVTQGTLSNWERGIHDPDNEILIILSKKFNVTTDHTMYIMHKIFKISVYFMTLKMYQMEILN